MADIFDILKQSLKNQQKTYHDLAVGLGVSEVTIKRIFMERDCKWRRLVDICDFLNLSISEVLAEMDQRPEQKLYLSLAVEQAMADDPNLYSVFILLREKMSLAEIAAQYNISENQLFKYAYKLEKLRIVEVHPGNEIRFLVKGILHLREQGPLQKLIWDVHLQFVRDCFQRREEQHQQVIYVSRRASMDSFEKLQDDIELVLQQFKQSSRRDRLMLPAEKLHLTKWVSCNSKYNIANFFDIIE